LEISQGFFTNLYFLLSTFYSLFSILYSLLSILYSLLSTLYSRHCHPLRLCPFGHPDGIITESYAGGKEIGAWRPRRASADRSIFSRRTSPGLAPPRGGEPSSSSSFVFATALAQARVVTSLKIMRCLSRLLNLPLRLVVWEAK